MAIQITIEPMATSEVTVDGSSSAISVAPTVTEVTANLALVDVGAASVSITPTGAVTATNIQDAIAQLADQNFRSDNAPTGANVEVGDTWYDQDDNIFYVYRTIDGVTDWVPLLTTDAPDETDGGAF
jgi:hypothetical protein